MQQIQHYLHFEWLKKEVSQMCQYWYLILCLEIAILLYIRSLRESNFLLYVQTIRNMMKWFFAFNHFNYACWGSIHLYYLMTVHSLCPDVHAEFMKGNSSFTKTEIIFSRISPDQVHEQNKEIIS